MKIGVPKATLPGETRVALIPETCAKLVKAGHQITVEANAGVNASHADSAYVAAGATVLPTQDVYDAAEVILMTHAPSETDLSRMKPDTVLIALLNPLVDHDLVRTLAERRITAIALELVPRITRAQSMDVLSSMSSLAGYKAVLIGANTLGKIFPMMMTAAGTIAAAKVTILGAGVAGLQAIATAKRLGALVSAYDVRPVVKEQVESLGAKFIEVGGPAEQTQDKGGYAKEVSDAYKQKQREVLAKHIAETDLAISTALIPGKPAPILITREMVHGMRPGSVIVDLAAEAGGNCELTSADETVVENHVTILGPRNLPATLPIHASQMFSRNMMSLLTELTKEGRLNLDPTNEIVTGVLVTQNGQVVHPRVRDIVAGPREQVAV